MNSFSDLEGLRMAINIEKLGYEFYRQAYERTCSPERKLLFGYLMQEELNHAVKFEVIYEKLKQYKQTGSEEYLFDAEVSRFLEVLVDTDIFPQYNPFENEPEIANGVLQTGWQWQMPGQCQSDTKIAMTVLRTALQAEKDSIRFYEEMFNHARFTEAKKVFAELKDEEKTHVEKLQDIIQAT